MSVTWLRYTQTNAGIEYGKKDASSPVASATKSSGIFCDISSSTKTLSRTRHTFFCRVTSVAGHSNQNLSPVPQAPVVQTLDSAIHRINHYPVDKIEMYPMDIAIHAIF